MIIEFLLLGDEAVANAEHVLSCGDEHCDDIAHLYDRLTARYAGLAEVFTFVAGTPRGHQYRLNRARAWAELIHVEKGPLALTSTKTESGTRR